MNNYDIAQISMISKLFQKKNSNFAITRSALFSSKCTRNRLAAGLRPDPLGELTALSQTPIAGLQGWAPGGKGPREGEGRKGGKGRGKEGREKGGKGKGREKGGDG